MSFEKGSVSLRVFRVKPGSQFPENAADRLANDAIQPVDLIPAEGCVGWSTGRHLLDRNITEDSVKVAGRIRVSLVKAEKRIPAALFKAECRQEELALMAATDRQFLKRSERAEISKSVQERMIPTMPPSLSGIDVVRVNDDIVYATAMGDSQVDLLTHSWKNTLGQELYPYTPALAATLLAKVSFNSLKSTSFSSAMADADVEQDIGTEFLTWMWYFSEACGGMSDGFGFALEGPFTFIHEGAGAHVVVVRKGNPGIASEAKSALVAGKKLKQAKLTIAKGEFTWACTINGGEWTFSSLKLPKGEQNDPVSIFEERLMSIGQFVEAVEGLFQKFLVIRIDEAKWKDEVSKIREWVDDRMAKA